jgi:cell division septation protein DedD
MMAIGAQIAAKDKDIDQINDAEITLSTGKLLGIFFAMAIICGVFFTMGYLLGKSTSAGGRTEIVGSSTSGPSAANKPFAGNKAPADTAAQNPSTTAAADSGATKLSETTASNQPDKGQTQASSQASGSEVKNGDGGSFMVQVAAVTKQEDAEILKTALQKKQYPVFVANSPGDPLFHVQVGPFTDKKDAEAMRTRLSGDGYNAIVK